MDNFAEQLVKRENLSSDNTKKAFIIVGIAVLGFLLSFTFVITLGTIISILALVLCIGVIYGGIKLLSGFSVEYEYTVTNGEIDIDKIIAQKKRKNLISFEAKKIKDIGSFNLETPDGNQETTVYASDNIESHEYYLDFEHDDYGLVRLIFSPNEKLLTAIKPFAPFTVRSKIPDYFTEGEDEE